MTRIQIVPLPTERAGDYERTPFILILDQVTDAHDVSAEQGEYMKHQTGAALILVSHEAIDAPGQLELTEEQRAQLHAYLTEPLCTVLAEDHTEPA